MKKVHTKIRINAEPEKVWNVLTDTRNYSEWNTFLVIRGDLKKGKRISVTFSPPKSLQMNYNPKVLVLDERREIKWQGNVIVRGIFDREHKILLEEEDGKTLLTQEEVIEGLFAPIYSTGVTEKGLIMVNEAIKRKAESY